MHYPETFLRSHLQLAEQAIAQGVKEIGHSRLIGSHIESSVGRDIKLEADRLADAAIKSFLAAKSNYGILSEESGYAAGSEGEFRWIVDPLDGSFNFHRGLPFYGCSVALWHDNTPVLGAILDIERQELFSGAVGLNVLLNGKPVSASDVAQEKDAVLCTGFPVAADFSSGAMDDHYQRARRYKKVRMLGSAALSLCQVACGRADYYFEQGIQIWDIAGGLALIKAAGGKFSMEFLGEGKGWKVEATNAKLALTGIEAL